MTTSAAASLNRSYDTATAGRRTRSAAAGARSTAKRSRMRPASSTPSMPAAAAATKTADGGDERTVAQDGGDQATADGDTSGLLGRRRRRRRRTENETEKEAEQLQLTLDDDQPVNGSFATPADSNLLDLGSPRNAETVKTKKRIRRKPRGSSEALSSNANDALTTVSQEFEPDLSISKDFSQSFEMRTSSPVEIVSIEPQSVPDVTENKASETEYDPNLWMMFDTRLNDLCKQLLTEQNFDKLYPDDSSHIEAKKMTERTTELPLKVRSQENQVDTIVLPLSPVSAVFPTTNERPLRLKAAKHKKQIDDVPAEQQTGKRKKDSRLSEDASQFSMEPDAGENRNVSNILSVRERPVHTGKSYLAKNKDTEDIAEKQPAKTYENDSSQFLTEPDTTVNMNVPNILSLRQADNSKLVEDKKETEDVPAEQLTETSESNSKLRKDSRPDTDDNRNIPNISSQFVREPDTTVNMNVPNILSLRQADTYNAKLVKDGKETEDVPAEQLTETCESNSKDSRPDTDENRNVPNISSSREPKRIDRLSSPDSSEPPLRETSGLERAEVRGIPDVIPSSPTPEPATQAADEIRTPDDVDDDVIAAEELERLEREQRQLMEEEQEQNERLEEEEQVRREKEIQEEQERKREQTEKRERKRQEKEDKERRKKERKEKKEIEKRQREMLANELPVEHSNEPQQVQVDHKTTRHTGSPTESTPDSEHTKQIVEVKIGEPGEILPPSDDSQRPSSRTLTTRNDVIEVKTAVYDPYDNIPMVDDVVDEENIPPVDYCRSELTPVIEKSAKKKPPSGRKMPPRSPLFPAPVPAKPEDGGADGQKDTLTYFRITPPRTTLKEAKARDRESSARQRSRSADRALPRDRGQSHRTSPHFTVVDIDIESAPEDSAPVSLSASFDGGRPFSASSPIPPDFVGRSLRPARSEEVLFVKKLSSRSPTPSYGHDSSVSCADGGQWIRAAKSTDCLNRSLAGSEMSYELGTRSLSREWQVVTTTTKEEIVFVNRPGEDTEERKQIKAEYEKNKQVREMNEQRMTKEREKIERVRLERLLAELRRRRQKERQKLLEKKLAEKRAKEENDRFIRQAIEEQRQKRLEEDRDRREQEQKKRDELNEKWRTEREQREKLAKEKRERIERERQEKLEIECQLQLQMEEKERQEQEEQDRRSKELQELQEKREKEEKERREMEQKEKMERERQRKEQLAHEEKLRLEQLEKEAKLLQEKMETERMENEARWREEEKKRLEKEREMMEKLAEDHILKLEKLEEETRLQQERLERERLEKEQEIMEKLAEEHRFESEKLEKETRLQQKQLERERLEKEENKRILREKMEKEEKLAEEEKRKLELEKLEKEALEKIIQEQKLRLKKLEREEQLRADKSAKEHIEKDERRLKSSSQEYKEPDTIENRNVPNISPARDTAMSKSKLAKSKKHTKDVPGKQLTETSENDSRLSEDLGSAKVAETVGVSATEQEVVDVFADQPSTNLLTPSSPLRPRLPSQDMATQTDDCSGKAAVVDQVRQYPAAVITERLVSDSESPTSSPVPSTDDPAPSPIPRSADSPVRKRARSTGSVDDDKGDVTPVVVHEYSELLSFWRGDPTGGQLTLVRANSRRAAGADGEGEATVQDVSLPPEQWSTKLLDSVEQPPNDGEVNQSKSVTQQPSKLDDPAEPVRQRHDDDDDRPASATDDHEMSEKTFVHSTLGWIGQYILRHST